MSMYRLYPDVVFFVEANPIKHFSKPGAIASVFGGSRLKNISLEAGSNGILWKCGRPARQLRGSPGAQPKSEPNTIESSAGDIYDTENVNERFTFRD